MGLEFLIRSRRVHHANGEISISGQHLQGVLVGHGEANSLVVAENQLFVFHESFAHRFQNGSALSRHKGAAEAFCLAGREHSSSSRQQGGTKPDARRYMVLHGSKRVVNEDVQVDEPGMSVIRVGLRFN